MTIFHVISRIWPELAIGFAILAIIAFIAGVNLGYCNKPSLKFAADKELDISQVNFEFRDILE